MDEEAEPMTCDKATPTVPQDPPAALRITLGRVLAERYEVRTPLGTGTTGQVYAALDRLRKEEISLKVFFPHLLADPKVRECFLNDARAAGRLAHRNIMRVFGAERTTELTFLSMELLKGRSLRAAIDRRRQTAERFSVEAVQRIAEAVCAALAYAHPECVHGEPTPENIWLCEDNKTVKLMGFGMVQLLRSGELNSEMKMRTACYLAPERLKGGKADHRADQYTVGVVLYELLTGKLPVAEAALEAPHEVRRIVPEPMSRAVIRALEARPKARHADMAALGRALAGRSGRRLGKRRAAALVAAALVGTVGALSLWRPWVAAKGHGRAAANAAPEGIANLAAAEEAYREQWRQVEKLKEPAEAVGAAIVAAAKNSPSEVAEQVAELWQRRARRKDWLAQAGRFLTDATAQAEKRSFDQASAELRAAEAEYRKPVQWWTNARGALESIDRTRVTIQKQVEQFPPEWARSLLSWPEALAGAVKDRLLEGDGAEGLAETQRVAALLPKLEQLLSLRRAAVEAASSAGECAQAGGFRGRYEAASSRLQEGDAALTKERLTDARRLYRLAERDFGAVRNEYVAYLVAAGKHALDTGKNYDTAITDLQKALEVDPTLRLSADLARAYARRAELALEKEDYDHAVADCNRAIANDPSCARAFHIRGAARAEKPSPEFDAAIRDQTAAIRLLPSYPHAFNTRGRCWDQKGELDKAIADYTEAIRLDRTFALAYNNRGISWRRNGNLYKAIADHTEAIRLDPSFAPAYSNRAQLSEVTGQFDEAIADYEQTTRLDPMSAEDFQRLAWLLVFKRRYDEAVAAYSSALELDPKNAVLRVLRGRRWLKQKKYDKAIADFEEAIRLDPKNAWAFFERGNARFHLNMRDEVSADYATAERLAPKAYSDFCRLFPSRMLVREVLREGGSFRHNPEFAAYAPAQGDDHEAPYENDYLVDLFDPGPLRLQLPEFEFKPAPSH
jgi:tetratricopeptide (TPR) repeat protein